MLLGLTAALAAGGVSTAAAGQDSAEETGALAQYEGKTINLAESWEGADVCRQQASGELNCWDEADEALTAAGSEVGIQAASDCTASYFCLWDGANFTGARLELPMDTFLDLLSNYGFEDRASSVYNRSVYFAQLFDNDYSDFPSLAVAPGSQYSDLNTLSHPYGGTWNDRADLAIF